MARRVQTAVAEPPQRAVLRGQVVHPPPRAVRELAEPMARRVQTAVAVQVLRVVLAEVRAVAVLRARRVLMAQAVRTAVAVPRE